MLYSVCAEMNGRLSERRNEAALLDKQCFNHLRCCASATRTRAETATAGHPAKHIRLLDAKAATSVDRGPANSNLALPAPF